MIVAHLFPLTNTVTIRSKPVEWGCASLMLVGQSWACVSGGCWCRGRTICGSLEVHAACSESWGWWQRRCVWPCSSAVMNILVWESAAAFVAGHTLLLLRGAALSDVVLMRVLAGGGAQ